LSGCSFLTSYELTWFLGVDLCSSGKFTSLRMVCPVSCGCGSMVDCPAQCHPANKAVDANAVDTGNKDADKYADDGDGDGDGFGDGFGDGDGDGDDASDKGASDKDDTENDTSDKDATDKDANGADKDATEATDKDATEGTDGASEDYGEYTDVDNSTRRLLTDGVDVDANGEKTTMPTQAAARVASKKSEYRLQREQQDKATTRDNWATVFYSADTE